jgi:hypothetical protein
MRHDPAEAAVELHERHDLRVNLVGQLHRNAIAALATAIDLVLVYGAFHDNTGR